jgi:DNA invertase Pin-like site-specific DNA recombinase
MPVNALALDQQKVAIPAAGVTKIFSDVMSGARDDPPGLAELLGYIRPGDSVIVWRSDRLAATHCTF